MRAVDKSKGQRFAGKETGKPTRIKETRDENNAKRSSCRGRAFLCVQSAQATILTYQGGLGPGEGEIAGVETPGTTAADFFEDSIPHWIRGEKDVHDDQALGDNVTGAGPDANGFYYGDGGEGFTPNVTVTHGPGIRRHSAFGGTFAGVSGGDVVDDGFDRRAV